MWTVASALVMVASGAGLRGASRLQRIGVVGVMVLDVMIATEQASTGQGVK